jgi:hypothetical protein
VSALQQDANDHRLTEREWRSGCTRGNARYRNPIYGMTQGSKLQRFAPARADVP